VIVSQLTQKNVAKSCFSIVDTKEHSLRLSLHYKVIQGRVCNPPATLTTKFRTRTKGEFEVSVSNIMATAMASLTVLAMSSETLLALGSRGGRSESRFGPPSFVNPGRGQETVVNTNTPGGSPASVPEIDASTGLLAMAAVLAVMAFVWERNRRRHA
jgi:hypothetical protein